MPEKSLLCIHFGKSRFHLIDPTSLSRLVARYNFPIDSDIIDLDAEDEPFFYNPYCKCLIRMKCWWLTPFQQPESCLWSSRKPARNCEEAS